MQAKGQPAVPVMMALELTPPMLQPRILVLAVVAEAGAAV
jgi:hypothetical protein